MIFVKILLVSFSIFISTGFPQTGTLNGSRIESSPKSKVLGKLKIDENGKPSLVLKQKKHGKPKKAKFQRKSRRAKVDGLGNNTPISPVKKSSRSVLRSKKQKQKIANSKVVKKKRSRNLQKRGKNRPQGDHIVSFSKPLSYVKKVLVKNNIKASSPSNPKRARNFLIVADKDVTKLKKLNLHFKQVGLAKRGNPRKRSARKLGRTNLNGVASSLRSTLEKLSPPQNGPRSLSSGVLDGYVTGDITDYSTASCYVDFDTGLYDQEILDVDYRFLIVHDFLGDLDVDLF